ncbi:TPA: hypothetical protein QDC55_001690 [Burkholderia cenocepacia]|nr:hypothetical protein [Burkholderia cenocepacia]HDR9828160.1 hypothetical protein [Burkholderia cenocepacia]
MDQLSTDGQLANVIQNDSSVPHDAPVFPIHFRREVLEIAKSQLIAAMSLGSKYSWLIEKSAELVELLFEECKTEDERKLIHDLFDRFVFVTQSKMSDYTNQLAEEIATTPFLTPENTIIAAMAADSSPDSSQFLVQFIKVKLQQLNWSNVEIVNTFGSAFKTSKKSGFKRLNIVVIDEFIGSGKTAVSRNNAIRTQFSEANQNANILIKSIFCSRVGIDHLNKNDVNFAYLEEIKRGITDFESDQAIAKKRLLDMQNLEKWLSHESGTHKMSECTLGYGQTESLIALEKANIPNSVFPIFWWTERIDGTQRKTLFTRWIGK